MKSKPICCAIVPNLGVVPITLLAMLGLDGISAVLLRDLNTVTEDMRRGAKFDFLFVDLDVLGEGAEVSVALARLRQNFPEIAVIVLSGRIEDDFHPPPDACYDVALQIPVGEAALDLARIHARVNRVPSATGMALPKLIFEQAGTTTTRRLLSGRLRP